MLTELVLNRLIFISLSFLFSPVVRSRMQYSDDSLDEYGNDEFIRYTTERDARSPSASPILGYWG